MALKDLVEKIKNDEAFAEGFKGLKSVDEIVAKAKEAGFDLTDADIDELSKVSAEDLEKAAGGMIVLAYQKVVLVTNYGQ